MEELIKISADFTHNSAVFRHENVFEVDVIRNEKGNIRGLTNEGPDSPKLILGVANDDFIGFLKFFKTQSLPSDFFAPQRVKERIKNRERQIFVGDWYSHQNSSLSGYVKMDKSDSDLMYPEEVDNYISQWLEEVDFSTAFLVKKLLKNPDILYHDYYLDYLFHQDGKNNLNDETLFGKSLIKAYPRKRDFQNHRRFFS